MKAAFDSLSEYTDFFLTLNIFFCSPSRLSDADLEAAGFPAFSAQLRQAYSDVIYGTSGLALPLWESAALKGRQVLLDSTTLSVIRAYRGQGLGADDNGNPADYLGTQSGFLAWMLSGGKYREARTFLQNHLLPFTRDLASFIRQPQTASLLQEYDFHGFFRDLFLSLPSVCESAFHRISENADASGRPSACGRGLCASAGPVPVCGLHPLTEAEKCSADTSSVVMTAGRGNCGGRCILYSHVTDGCVLKLSTDRSDGSDGRPVLRACERGFNYRGTFLSSRRLKFPMKRVGERGDGRFARISWEEATSLIASQMERIKDTYGPDSRYLQYGSGINSVIRGSDFCKRLLSLDGGYLGRYNSYSSACTSIATPYTYGTAVAGTTPNVLQETNYLILWGNNAIETFHNGELLQALKKIREKGAPIIVIDPRFSDTAKALATQWVPIRPGTDAALAVSMAYVIVTEHLQDQEFLDRYCIGFDRAHMPQPEASGRGSDQDAEPCVLDYLLGRSDGTAKTPQWGEAVTGVPADTIIRLARGYATTKPAALYPGLGPQRHSCGEQTTRCFTLLACLTGNVGREGTHSGGNMAVTEHAIPEIPVPENPCHVRIPCFLWTDAIERGSAMTEKDDRIRGRDRLRAPIKMIFNIEGNTLINQHSDTFRTAQILRDTSKAEFIVTSDLFMTASAMYSDLVLPSVSLFENANISTPWEQGNFLLCSRPAVRPLFEGRFEYDWLKDVAEKIGLRDAFVEGKETVSDWMRYVYDQIRPQEPELPPFDAFYEKGGYKYAHHPRFVAFREQIEDPAHHPFDTPSGKIELYSPRLKELKKIAPIPEYEPGFEGYFSPQRARYPLQLIGFHNKTHTHSTHDSNEMLQRLEPHCLWIHPEDAAARGIAQGQVVRVFNDRGEIRIPAFLTDRIMPGVVAMPQGRWSNWRDLRGLLRDPRTDGENSSAAARIDHNGNINTLTTQRPTPLAKGNPQHSNLVEVAAICYDGSAGQTQDRNGRSVSGL